MRRLLLGLVTILTISAPIALSAPAQAATDTTPVIGNFASNLDTFYPTVRDGFRDDIWLHGRAKNVYDESGDLVRQPYNITIRNTTGGKVAEHDGRVNTYFHDLGWEWNGKNPNGNPVPTGAYKATLTVTNPSTGETDTSVTTVRATSDTVNRRITKSRTGVDTSSRWRRGLVQVTRNGWFDGPNSLYLDCWGGKTGVVYNFTIPRDARNVTWSVNGSKGAGFDGRIIKTGKRISPTRYRVAVEVTGWEAYSIKSANVTYTTTVQR